MARRADNGSRLLVMAHRAPPRSLHQEQTDIHPTLLPPPLPDRPRDWGTRSVGLVWTPAGSLPPFRNPTLRAWRPNPLRSIPNTWFDFLIRASACCSRRLWVGENGHGNIRYRSLSREGITDEPLGGFPARPPSSMPGTPRQRTSGSRCPGSPGARHDTGLTFPALACSCPCYRCRCCISDGLRLSQSHARQTSSRIRCLILCVVTNNEEGERSRGACVGELSQSQQPCPELRAPTQHRQKQRGVQPRFPRPSTASNLEPRLPRCMEAPRPSSVGAHPSV